MAKNDQLGTAELGLLGMGRGGSPTEADIQRGISVAMAGVTGRDARHNPNALSPADPVRVAGAPTVVDGERGWGLSQAPRAAYGAGSHGAAGGSLPPFGSGRAAEGRLGKANAYETGGAALAEPRIPKGARGVSEEEDEEADFRAWEARLAATRARRAEAERSVEARRARVQGGSPRCSKGGAGKASPNGEVLGRENGEAKGGRVMQANEHWESDEEFLARLAKLRAQRKAEKLAAQEAAKSKLVLPVSEETAERARARPESVRISTVRDDAIPVLERVRVRQDRSPA